MRIFGLLIFLHTFAFSSNVDIKDCNKDIEAHPNDQKNSFNLSNIMVKNNEQEDNHIDCHSFEQRYNLKRFNLMEDYFKEFQSCSISKNVGQLIGEYDYEDSIYEFREIIINELNPSQEEREKLDFYKGTFASQLLSLLSSNTENQKNHLLSDFFWYGVMRIVFKWMIHMRQALAYNDNGFKAFLKDIEEIDSIVSKKTFRVIPTSLDADNMKNSEFKQFKELIKCEFIENIQLFSLFTLVTEKFYGSIIDGKKESLSAACDHLKNHYFQGNFNNNLLLKYIIFMYDPRGKIKTCFPGSEHEMFQSKNIPAELSVSDYLLKEMTFRQRKMPKNIEEVTISYVSKFISEFFLDNGLKFQINRNSDLVFLLRKLESVKMLTIKPISEIVKFKSLSSNTSPPTFEWNEAKFKEILDFESKSDSYFDSGPNISLEERDRYLGLI